MNLEKSWREVKYRYYSIKKHFLLYLKNKKVSAFRILSVKDCFFFFASLLVVSAVLITSLISILKGLVKLDYLAILKFIFCVCEYIM